MTATNDGMIAAIAIMAVIGVYLVVFGILIANYIMTARSLYTIGKRRGLNSAWLAWVPFADNWVVGAITDEYDQRLGFVRKWRVILITLTAVGYVPLFGGYGGMFAEIIGEVVESYPYEPMMEEIIVPFIVMYVCMLAAVFVLTALSFVRMLCMFKIFESTVPEKAVKYFLLSLLVPLASGICLLKCKDKGYSVVPENNASINDVNNPQG